MKTKFICILSLTALLLSCSNDESNTQNETQSVTTESSTFYQKATEIEVEAPFKSCSYENMSHGVAEINFEVPDNYQYNVIVQDGAYFIDIVSEDTKDNETYITYTESLNYIDGVMDVTFSVNGRMVRKPKISVIEM
jgi:uncharacterized protein YcfL